MSSGDVRMGCTALSSHKAVLEMVQIYVAQCGIIFVSVDRVLPQVLIRHALDSLSFFKR